MINPHMHCLGDTSLRPRTNNTFPLDDFCHKDRSYGNAHMATMKICVINFCPCNVTAAQIQTSLNLCSLSQGQICPSSKDFSLEQVCHMNGIVAVSCPHVTSLPPPVSAKRTHDHPALQLMQDKLFPAMCTNITINKKKIKAFARFNCP